MKKKLIYLFIIALAFSCTEENVITNSSSTETQVIHKRFNNASLENITLNLSEFDAAITKKGASTSETSATRFMEAVNAELEINDMPFQLSMIEYYSFDGAGNTIFFNDRGNKQLAADFVPGDSRRGGFSDIAYARDGTEGVSSSGLTQAQTDGAILRAMDTWNSISCSDGLILTDLGSALFDLGYVEALVTGGVEGSYFYTDLMHSGFNTTVTDAVFGPGSTVLGVTFTFTYESDIDNNGKDDVAFRDIYYNDAYNWGIGAGVDVETVVLHETGHGLSQGHFGKLSRTNSNGKFHFSPSAVMNAGYTGIQRSISATDNAGHCSNWAQWPNN